MEIQNTHLVHDEGHRKASERHAPAEEHGGYGHSRQRTPGTRLQVATSGWAVRRDAESGAPYPSDYPPDKFVMIQPVCPKDLSTSLFLQQKTLRAGACTDRCSSAARSLDLRAGALPSFAPGVGALRRGPAKIHTAAPTAAVAAAAAPSARLLINFCIYGSYRKWQNFVP